MDEYKGFKQPAYQKKLDDKYCTIYTSFNGLNETIFYKDTLEITYRKLGEVPTDRKKNVY